QPPRHRRQPGPSRLGRALLVPDCPLQPAQLHQGRGREHLHRPPAPPPSRAARHRHIPPGRPPAQVHRPHPPPEQPQVGRIGPGPRPPVAPRHLLLTPPAGPRPVPHHPRRRPPPPLPPPRPVPAGFVPTSGASSAPTAPSASCAATNPRISSSEVAHPSSTTRPPGSSTATPQG